MILAVFRNHIHHTNANQQVIVSPAIKKRLPAITE